MKIASEMYDRGELWVPYWIGELDYHKPPLSYWLMMLLFLLGDDRVSLASLLTAGLIYWIGKKLYRKDAGLIASLLALSSFGLLHFADNLNSLLRKRLDYQITEELFDAFLDSLYATC